MLEQDLYYKDQSHLPFEERLNTNYDHPLAFDNDYLIEHLNELLAYKPIKKPIYDYKLHTRSEEVVHVDPKDVIILEGILVLEDERLRDLMDIKLYVDTDADLRIIRRMVRDIKKEDVRSILSSSSTSQSSDRCITSLSNRRNAMPISLFRRADKTASPST